MANTGYRITPTLRRVTDDVNEFPLDINDQLCSVTGLPQATMPNPSSSPDYRVRDGSCLPFTFFKQADFQKNNCVGDGYQGTFVTHSEIYTSTISQADAEAQAAADVAGFNTRGQAQANAEGSCIPPPDPDVVGIVVIDLYQLPGLEACVFIDTPGAEAPYRQPCYTGNNFFPNNGTIARNCWLLASDYIASSSTSHRFEVNVGRLLQAYPTESTFTIKVRGRMPAAQLHNGAYSLKGAEVGYMVMNGTPGNYIPSVASTINLEISYYSGRPIVGGADGNIGIEYGADILTFEYNVALKTLTLI